MMPIANVLNPVINALAHKTQAIIVDRALNTCGIFFLLLAIITLGQLYNTCVKYLPSRSKQSGV